MRTSPDQRDDGAGAEVRGRKNKRKASATHPKQSLTAGQKTARKKESQRKWNAKRRQPVKARSEASGLSEIMVAVGQANVVALV